ncbi:hypothetical protein A1O1_04483 [Capronia coronata CBS 617.96]|uniref:Uncharacterized protein n=1 Tax=Capronia coronata CBS 617.96 TaxID=1182541 RepID=W9YQ70_9EURO|nr:uncharacterized protein A1O1_04483 [Capronia coronata CBS 617.96]EXJ91371.1 hypothetical protein A1O1_04483 [Capronia coronata CBS 617.96]
MAPPHYFAPEAFTAQIERLGRLPEFFQTLPLRRRLALTVPLPLPLPPRARQGLDDDNMSTSSSIPSPPTSTPVLLAEALARAQAQLPPPPPQQPLTAPPPASWPPGLARTYEQDPNAYGRQTPVVFHVENVLRHLVSLYFDRQRGVMTIEFYAAVAPGQPDPATSGIIRMIDLWPPAAGVGPVRHIDAIIPDTFKQKTYPKDGNVRATLRVFKQANGAPVTGVNDVLPQMKVEVSMLNGARDKAIRDREQKVADRLVTARAQAQPGLAVALPAPVPPAMPVASLYARRLDVDDLSSRLQRVIADGATAAAGPAPAPAPGPMTGDKRKRAD